MRGKDKAKLIVAVVCIVGIALLSWSIASTLAKPDYIALGLAEYEAGNYEKAVEFFTKAIERDLNNAIAYYDRGLAYSEIGKKERIDPNEKAIADFSKAIELNPNFIDAYYNRGLLYCGLGHSGIHHYHKLPTEPWPPEIEERYKKALADFNKCLELDPNYALAHAGKGNLFYKYYDSYEDMKKAIAEYNKALEGADFILQKAGKKGLAGVYYSRGRAYTYMGLWDKAESDYLKAIELDSNCRIALGHLAHLYIDLERYPEALELCARYEKAAGGATVHSLDFKGTAYYHLGEYDKAIKAFEELAASSHWPTMTLKAYRYLGMIYQAKGDKEKAEEYYKKAIDLATKIIAKGEKQISTQVAIAYYHRGLVYAELGEHERSIQDLSKVIELKVASDREYGHENYYIKSHIALGRIYSKIGEKGKAMEYFERALELLQRPGGPEPIKKKVEELLKNLT